MSKLYDFLYADTGVVKNTKNCHDADILGRYSETALRSSLPLLNSLKFNLKNMKALNKHLFGDLIYNAGETKVELGIENENLADFNSAKEMFDKEWIKERVKDEEVDARKFAEKMAFFLVTVEATNPFLYGSLDTYCTYANYIAKVNGIDMDFNRIDSIKKLVKVDLMENNKANDFLKKQSEKIADDILITMQPLSLNETNEFRKHFGLKPLTETKVVLNSSDSNKDGFILSSKNDFTEKIITVNDIPTEKYLSAVSNTAEAIIHLEHYTKDKNTAWRKTDKIINEPNQETKVIYDLNKFGEEEAVKTIVENDKTTKEFNHRNGICTTQLSNYKDVFIQTNFQGNEIIRTSPNILTKIDLKTLNEISDNGKNLSAIRDKYIIHKVNDDKLATITDVRKNGKNFEAIINYDNENYLVKDLGVQKGLFKFYELDNKINDATFEDHDRHEIYSSMRGMEMD